MYLSVLIFFPLVIDYGRKPSGVPVISLMAFTVAVAPAAPGATPPVPVGENTLLSLSMTPPFLVLVDCYYV
jgi:hypothetical protein